LFVPAVAVRRLTFVVGRKMFVVSDVTGARELERIALVPSLFTYKK